MTTETSNARGVVGVGDRVRAMRSDSTFYRYGDCGTVIRIDGDGDLWVMWDNPLDRDQRDHGWCIPPSECEPATPPPPAAVDEVKGYPLWQAIHAESAKAGHPCNVGLAQVIAALDALATQHREPKS